MEEILRCEALSKTYLDGEEKVTVLSSLNFKLNSGEKLAVVGSSGSGKSTLLHLLGGLDKPTAGDVFFAGKSLSKLSSKELNELRNQKMGFIYQFHHLLGEFTARENVAMPLLIGKVKQKTAYARADEILADVGLSHRAEHLPGALSGGERQRVAIARALVTQPSLVLADEPTGNLDKATGENIYALLSRLADQRKTGFVVVTHDLQLANRMDRVLKLENGCLKTTSGSKT